MKFGIFTDIHFQPKGLERIIATGNWIIEEFERRGVDHVFMLGDGLNTREEVSIEAQSACVSLFHRLADRWETDVLLGNHDLNLKHSLRISSLDALVMHPRMHVHRELGIRKVGSTEFLMMPYYEDQSKILEILERLKQAAPDRVAQMVGLGHLSINGAVQITRYNTCYAGTIGPDSFGCLKRTFTGHFHVHQDMDHRVTYIGSPLQFNFGDAGDERGVAIYDDETDTYEFVVNPHHDAFRFVNAKTLREEPEVVATMHDCFVTVIYDDISSEEEFERDQQLLLDAGVASVKRESVIERALRVNSEEEFEIAAGGSIVDLLPQFVRRVVEDETEAQVLTDYGLNIVRQVSERHTEVDDEGTVFEADLCGIVIEGFLGVTERKIIPFSNMADGVWIIEGENGDGKSTIFEAISWCQFGQTLRDDMKADDVVNDNLGRGRGAYVALLYNNGWAVERWRKGSPQCLDGSQGSTTTGLRVYRAQDDKWVYQENFEKGEPKATQAAVCNLLGIDYDKFTKAVVMGQNIVSNFVTANEKERRAIIEDMLGLERIGEYLQAVRDERKQINDELTDRQRVHELRGQELERIGQHISQIEQQIMQAEQERQVKLDSLAEQTAKAKDTLKGLQQHGQEALSQIKTRIEHAKEELEQRRSQVSQFEQQLVEYQKSESIREERVDIARRIERLQDVHTAYQSRLAAVQQEQAEAARQMEEVKQILDAAEQIERWGKALERRRELTRALEQTGYQIEAALSRKQEATNQGMQKEKELEKLNAGVCYACGKPIDPTSEQINAHKQVIDSLIAQANEAGEQESTARREQERFQAELAQLDVPDEAEVQRQQHQLTQARERYTRLSGVVDESYLTNAVRDYHNQLSTIDPSTTLEALPDRIAELTRQQEELVVEDARLDFNHEGYRQAQTARDAAERDVEKYATELQETESKIRGRERELEHQITEWQTEMKAVSQYDPAAHFAETRKQLDADRAGAMQAIEDAKAASVRLERQKAIANFWDKSFGPKGGLRGFLLEESVTSLNQIVRGYIDQMFPGLSLTFSPDLTIQERYGKRSGGQRKCSDLAVLFATFELVRQRTRFRPHFLCLDEVFDGLDRKRQKSIQEVITVLSQRVKKVMLITHADVSGLHHAGSIYTTMPSLDKGTQWLIQPV